MDIATDRSALEAWLFLLRAPGFGPVALRELLATHGDATRALRAARRGALACTRDAACRAWLDTPDHLSGQAPSARDFVKTCEVLTEALQFSARNITRREEMRVGAVLRKLGYVRERRQIDGGARAYVYARVPTLPYLCPT